MNGWVKLRRVEEVEDIVEYSDLNWVMIPQLSRKPTILILITGLHYVYLRCVSASTTSVIS